MWKNRIGWSHSIIPTNRLSDSQNVHLLIFRPIENRLDQTYMNQEGTVGYERLIMNVICNNYSLDIVAIQFKIGNQTVMHGMMEQNWTDR